MTTMKRRTAYDPLRLSVPLLEHREDETADLPAVRNQRILPRQAGDARGDAAGEVGEETTVSTSTERLDDIIGKMEKVVSGDAMPAEAYRAMIITPTELIDICRDA